MKKILFATVAMAAALVMGDAIESQNVVGYVNSDLGDNANLSAASFNKVGAAGMDIQDLEVSSDEMYSGAVSIKVLGSDLGDVAEYYYILAGEAASGDNDAGWYDESWETRINKTFEPGEGYIFVNNVGGTTSKCAGEVPVGKPTWELGDNANLAGNITPVDLDIQDIVVNTAVDADGNLYDEDGSLYSGAVSLKILGSDLGDAAEYYYILANEASSGDNDAGWYDESWETRIIKTFAPGEGFVLVNNLPVAFVQIPAAL